MAGILFEDIFDVKDIDPEGKKFDRGKRGRAPLPFVTTLASSGAGACFCSVAAVRASAIDRAPAWLLVLFSSRVPTGKGRLFLASKRAQSQRSVEKGKRGDLGNRMRMSGSLILTPTLDQVLACVRRGMASRRGFIEVVPMLWVRASSVTGAQAADASASHASADTVLSACLRVWVSTAPAEPFPSAPALACTRSRYLHGARSG